MDVAPNLEVGIVDPDRVVETERHTLYIEGLDGNYESVSETVTLDGTAAVTTTSTFLRVHTAYVTAGSAVTANAGAITCTNSTSGDTMFTIPATEGRTQLGVYTIPAGKTGYMMGLGLFVSGLTTATVNLDVRSRPFGQTPLVIRDEIATGAGSGHQHNHIIPLSFTEKSDIRLDATSTTANTRVAASFAMYLVDN